MRAFVAFLFAAALPCVGARAESMADMVRDLNAMQNRMVTGDATARDQSARQFDLIEKAIANVDSASWREERHARAAIVYLLCGGAAGGLRGVLAAKHFDEGLSSLLDASLLYAEGDPRARNALMAFDARQYPAMLGGHLALVQGGTLVGIDNAKAIGLFDLARLLMPGSLVEEAALRREISILDPVRDNEKLGLLSVRYAAKYSSSPFARHFWELFSNIALGFDGMAPPTSRVDLVLEKAPQPERFAFYLALSRRFILAGGFADADAALAKARMSALDPMQSRRVSAYLATLSALRGDQRATVLREIETSGLPDEDVRLVSLAASVGVRLEKPIDSSSQGDEASLSDDKYELEESVRHALAQTDELLKRAIRR